MGKPEDVSNFRRRIKIALVESFGSTCQLCKKTYPQSVFEFHHLNPEQKKFNLSVSCTRAKSDYAEEAKKCIMVCANCHRLIEYEGVDISNITCSFDTEKYFQILDELANKKVEIKKAEEQAPRYKPTQEELLQDLNNFNGNFSAVGRKYGFSSNAVVKWCKKFNMPYHSSDYKH